jgi:KDO2-lipid IV(A) lauroyltransferase
MMLWRLRSYAEAGCLWLALAFLRCLGPVAASGLGGAVARAIGPWLPVSRVADNNLRLALPELDATARKRVIRGVWDNLGRTIGEMPHVAALQRTADGPGWELAGEAVALRMVAHRGPIIMISAHIGNWEILPAIAAALGLRMALFYRAAANKRVDEIIVKLRNRIARGAMPQFAKGAAGARAAFGFLREGGMLGLLVDQKMNDGIAVPFFDRLAMTASAAASYALRFDCPVVPVHVERLGPARLRIICDEPITPHHTGDRHADITALTGQMNACVERWVRAHPEQWLWLHRRWPKSESA